MIVDLVKQTINNLKLGFKIYLNNRIILTPSNVV